MVKFAAAAAVLFSAAAIWLVPLPSDSSVEEVKPHKGQPLHSPSPATVNAGGGGAHLESARSTHAKAVKMVGNGGLTAKKATLDDLDPRNANRPESVMRLAFAALKLPDDKQELATGKFNTAIAAIKNTWREHTKLVKDSGNVQIYETSPFAKQADVIWTDLRADLESHLSAETAENLTKTVRERSFAFLGSMGLYRNVVKFETLPSGKMRIDDSAYDASGLRTDNRIYEDFVVPPRLADLFLVETINP